MIERRKKLGLRQEDAAAQVPCSPNTWGRWESSFRQPPIRAWIKIAKVLKITLGQLQRAAGQTLIDISGGEAKEPAAAPPGPRPVGPDDYEYLSIEASILDKILTNLDFHKLVQPGWHYHMEHWRAVQRENLRGIDQMMRAARNQAELIQKLHAHLLGNETGRIHPLPKPIKMDTPPPPKRGAPKRGGPKGKKRR